MLKCAKCSKDIASTKDGCCVCVKCQSHYHTACVSEAKTRASLVNWTCEKCDLKNKPSSISEQGNDKILEAISTLRSDMNKRLDSMQNKLDEMNGLKEKVDSVTEKANIIDDKVQQLNAEKSKLQLELTAAKKEINVLQKQTKKNNIVISGIPVQPNGTSVFPFLNRIAQLLNLPYCLTDFNAAHWLPVRAGDQRSQPIVVSFKEKKMASVWTNNGHVMAKRNPTSRPFRVRCLLDLQDNTLSAADATGGGAAPAPADAHDTVAQAPPPPPHTITVSQ
ncbi:uncharacterized protein LOC111049586 isoform X1 [Nilaparvata lugens]|uniref:uncharacterized protein LOC111049586 isoform X1 n=1 Tax=Nilaparvata lugens TaxID=108931 RepID=UPI00193D5050|nr:uncharacterized protein LOC111049586 isoform X1 [Nilaparvata lugens]